MLRVLLASGLLAALAPATPSAVPQSSASDVQDCISGHAFGGWDLPASRGDVGHARGVLVSDGTPALLLGAELHPELLPGGHPGGRIEGLLRLPDADRPVAAVRGHYLLRRDGSGVFRALILRPGARPDDPPTRIGRIEGVFRDPSLRPRSPGHFRARWMICR
jgi:hypothetical protein